MGQPKRPSNFPEVQQPKNGKRTTYDLIEPSELEFPQGWQWDPENELVINDKTGKIRNPTNGIIGNHSKIKCGEYLGISRRQLL